MAHTTKIFISATSADLTSFRDRVAQWVLDMGWFPVVQKHFPPDHKTVEAMLTKLIRGSDAVIHLVGECYGAEPKPVQTDHPRRSYTQIEAVIGRRLRKRVFVVLLDNNFPYDRHAPEPEELQQQQHFYRQQIQEGKHIFIPASAPASLEPQIRKLRVEIDNLRRSRSIVTLALSAALLATIGLSYYSWRARQRDMRDILTQVIQQSQGVGSEGTPESQRQLLHATVYRIAASTGMNPDALDSKLDAFIAETSTNEAATLRDQALAAFAKGDNAAAERLAGNAVNQIRHGLGAEDFKRRLIRDMYKLAGEAAINQKEWAKAENWYRQSLAVTSAENEPQLLADIGLALGRIFEEQERMNDALAAVVQVKTMLGQKLDELGGQGIAFLNSLARFQFLDAQYAESAVTLKEAISLSEKVSSGTPTGNTVYAWKLLAGAYFRMGEKDEAKVANAKTDAILSAALNKPPVSLNSLDSLLMRLSEASAVADIVRERQLRNGERIKVIEASVEAWASRVKTMGQLEDAWSGALDTERRALTVMNWCGYTAVAVFLLFGFPCLILFLRHLRRRPLKPKWLDHPLPASPDALTRTPEDLLSTWALNPLVPREILDESAQFLNRNPRPPKEKVDEYFRLQLQVIWNTQKIKRNEQRMKQQTDYQEALEAHWNSGRGIGRYNLVFGVLAMLFAGVGLTERWTAPFISKEPQIRSRVISGWREQAAFTSSTFGSGSDPSLLSEEVLAASLNLAVSTDRDRAESESVYRRVVAARQSEPKFARPELAKTMSELADVLKAEHKTAEAAQWVQRAKDLRSNAN